MSRTEKRDDGHTTEMPNEPGAKAGVGGSTHYPTSRPGNGYSYIMPLGLVAMHRYVLHPSVHSYRRGEPGTRAGKCQKRQT